ncbi:MAG: hypothetical protein KBS59_05890 [Clostridiales bacterium]|nr:hypothetical protein [Clostridiales bacterium]
MIKKNNPRLTARGEDGEMSSAYFFDNTASANEFTGMTPTAVRNAAAAESYLDLMGVPVTSMDGASAHNAVFPAREKKSEKHAN